MATRAAVKRSAVVGFFINILHLSVCRGRIPEVTLPPYNGCAKSHTLAVAGMFVSSGGLFRVTSSAGHAVNPNRMLARSIGEADWYR
jgi:hypothetical protein